MRSVHNASNNCGILEIKESLSQGLYKKQLSFKYMECAFSKSACFTLCSHESKAVDVIISHKSHTYIAHAFTKLETPMPRNEHGRNTSS